MIDMGVDPTARMIDVEAIQWLEYPFYNLKEPKLRDEVDEREKEI